MSQEEKPALKYFLLEEKVINTVLQYLNDTNAAVQLSNLVRNAQPVKVNQTEAKEQTPTT